MMKSTKTKERIEQAKKLRSSGLSYQKIADNLGVSKQTILRWFNPNIANRDKSYCKNWHLQNKVRKSEYDRLYYQNNKNRLQTQQTVYKRNKRKTDIQTRISHNLRRRLHHAIRHHYKAGSAVGDLGCSIKQLKQHLEDQFQEGMSWDNYGQWHIDHIKPLANFDLTDRAQFLEACHYTNLQPLWSIDNLKKSNN